MVNIIYGTALSDYLIGTNESDMLLGDEGVDHLYGGAGDDFLNGGSATDIDYLAGGVGNDSYLYRSGAEIISENAGEGIDTVYLASFSYLLPANVENVILLPLTSATSATGNTENNVMIGNEQMNTLTGNNGNDTLDGGAGNDTLNGGQGNDTYILAAPGDIVNEAAGAVNGIDTIIASYNINGPLSANVENLRLVEGSAATTATGNAGDNMLTGNSAANTMSGADGLDVLIGGLGKDSLTGGLKADQFKFNSVKDSVVGANRDVIQDFNHTEGDKINLAAIDAKTTQAGNQAFSFIGAQAFHHVAGELRFAGGNLSGDINGDGAADFQIRVIGPGALVLSDFVL